MARTKRRPEQTGKGRAGVPLGQVLRLAPLPAASGPPTPSPCAGCGRGIARCFGKKQGPAPKPPARPPAPALDPAPAPPSTPAPAPAPAPATAPGARAPYSPFRVARQPHQRSTGSKHAARPLMGSRACWTPPSSPSLGHSQHGSRAAPPYPLRAGPVRSTCVSRVPSAWDLWVRCGRPAFAPAAACDLGYCWFSVETGFSHPPLTPGLQRG